MVVATASTPRKNIREQVKTARTNGQTDPSLCKGLSPTRAPNPLPVPPTSLGLRQGEEEDRRPT
jgi:hypothetical protein